jgi:hypothetical protein
LRWCKIIVCEGNCSIKKKKGISECAFPLGINSIRVTLPTGIAHVATGNTVPRIKF